VNLEELDPAALALGLAQIAETDPHHEVIVAARLALEIADARRAHHRALRETALDVHGGDVATWRALAAREPRSTILARRAQPGPLAPERAA
jgi:hypothetical protein